VDWGLQHGIARMNVSIRSAVMTLIMMLRGLGYCSSAAQHSRQSMINITHAAAQIQRKVPNEDTAQSSLHSQTHWQVWYNATQMTIPSTSHHEWSPFVTCTKSTTPIHQCITTAWQNEADCPQTFWHSPPSSNIKYSPYSTLFGSEFHVSILNHYIYTCTRSMSSLSSVQQLISNHKTDPPTDDNDK